ncbi:MAG: glycoside hydrolase family 3 N-terminal domain-containing protein [Lachnospiraceae bacterium]|nr:glycoside hydrolase family 3 N-terminal domain-containing protein [Lachnospiraceae bacterium]
MMWNKKSAAAALAAAGMLGMGSMTWAADARTKAMQQMETMSREEKVGQMLMVTPAQLCDGADWTANADLVVQNMNQYHIGGLILFDEDLKNTEAVSALAAALEKSSDTIPALLAAGTGGSLETGFAKPAAGDASVLAVGQLASGADVIWAYSLAEEPGEDLTALGLASLLAPGEGTEFAVVTNDKAKNPLDDGRPASMAKSMVTAELKENLQFEGIVMTDSLSMAAATENYGGDMAAMYALQAGADILTAPASPATTCNGILSALDEQLVTEEQIDASVLKILTMKAELGIWK